MNFSFKHTLLAAAVLGFSLAANHVFSQAAQDPRTVATELEQSRTVNEAKREATIAANVEFTLAEKSVFWPLYWEYRSKVNTVDDAYIRIIEEYSTRYQSMDDRTARRLTKAWLQVQFDRYTLKKQYIEQFEAAIPAAKALRVFQIENRLDVMIDAAIGRKLPLSVPNG